MASNELFVGIDGCRAGWLAASMSREMKPEFEVFSDADDFWRAYRDAAIVLFDIPIGLRDEGPEPRRCDTGARARNILGPVRRSSVFPAPCRGAIAATSYPQACRINKQRTGRGLSRQTYCLTKKIKEVDELLRRDEEARRRIRECHPEVCFWGLAGRRPMDNRKKVRAGREERLAVLARYVPHVQEVFDVALSKWRRREVARDDILDAMAAGVTAIGYPDELATIPETPEIDSSGLWMEMVYRRPA